MSTPAETPTAVAPESELAPAAAVSTVEPTAEATEPATPESEESAPAAAPESTGPIARVIAKVNGRAPLLAQIERMSIAQSEVEAQLGTSQAALVAAQTELATVKAQLATANADLAAAQAAVEKLPAQVSNGVQAELEKVGVAQDELPPNLNAEDNDPEALKEQLSAEKDPAKRWAIAEKLSALEGVNVTK